uniref:Retrotransposon gag domain-containing protein n=1 Tax=Ficus carica TaxID=3494 RepID=A0AA88CRU7_FICCA|nr:hypothetical protein TIFTF001_046285 [Ficus carica]
MAMLENVGHGDNVGWCLSLVVATRAMPPKRRRAPIQDVDLAAQLNELRQMMKDARLWWETVKLQRGVTQMTWEDFVEEFKAKYSNTEIMEAQQDEFDKFRQGNLSVAEAVKNLSS